MRKKRVPRPHEGRHADMMQRCYNKNNRSYKNYGGRGIRVCKEWHDTHVFEKWAVEKYVEGFYLDRIDNNKGYSPSNCRFVDAHTSCVNRRKTKERLEASRKGAKAGTIVNTLNAKLRFNKAKAIGGADCIVCMQFTPLSNMSVNKRRVAGVDGLCKPCAAKRAKKYRKQRKISHNKVRLNKET